MIAVIDSSALLRLFIPDGPVPVGLESFMRGVERGNHVAIAPELTIVESVNVIVKKQRHRELSEAEAEELVSLLHLVPIRYHRHHSLMVASYSVAIKTGLSAYDALFLALALDRGVPLFTADDKLQKVVIQMGLLPTAE